MAADTALDTAFAEIANRVIPGASLLQHRLLSGGVSAAVHVLDVSTPRGPTSLVVRRHGAATWKQLPDDVTQVEFSLLAALHEARLPVPEPLFLDVDRQLLPSPYFVMRFVRGSSEIAAPVLDHALRSMAAFLARLHSLDVRALSLPPLPSREDPIKAALQFAADDSSLCDVISSLSPEQSPPTLLHGDFWPGNILWDKGEITAVLDWEDVAIGPAASDVACCRAEVNVLFGLDAARSFTQYYRAASANSLHDLTLWDFYVSSAALASLSKWRLPPEVETERRERTVEFRAHAIDRLTRG